jgi:hypothetical protein
VEKKYDSSREKGKQALQTKFPEGGSKLSKTIWSNVFSKTWKTWAAGTGEE